MAVFSFSKIIGALVNYKDRQTKEIFRIPGIGTLCVINRVYHLNSTITGIGHFYFPDPILYAFFSNCAI